jgi:hypothetical protein
MSSNPDQTDDPIEKLHRTLTGEAHNVVTRLLDEMSEFSVAKARRYQQTLCEAVRQIGNQQPILGDMLMNVIEAVVVMTTWAIDRNRALEALIDPDRFAGEALKRDGVLLKVPQGAAKLLAHSFSQTLGDAPNYVVLDVLTDPPMSVTIQRKGKKSPFERQTELEHEVEKLRARVNELEAHADVNARLGPSVWEPREQTE